MQQKAVWCWHCVWFVVVAFYTQYMNIKVYVSASLLLYVFCRKILSRYAIFSKLVVHGYSMHTSHGCLVTQMTYMCPLHDEIHGQMILTRNILLPIF
jgi:hypothetical protein